MNALRLGIGDAGADALDSKISFKRSKHAHHENHGLPHISLSTTAIKSVHESYTKIKILKACSARGLEENNVLLWLKTWNP